MTAGLALIVGAAVGMGAGALLIPVTQRQLTAAVARADADLSRQAALTVRWQRIALVVISGAVPGAVLARSGWSLVTIPPLILLLGLVQLAYCDLTRLLLPRTMVHATTVAVVIAAVAVTGATHDWHRLMVAALGGLSLFGLLLAINLVNPAWMAFGDVRLSPAIGMGLAWITPLALLQGFLLANVLAAVVGLVLILVHRAGRSTALPFGLYLAVAAAAIVYGWS